MSSRRCVLAVCALDKKLNSKPMLMILDHLRAYGEFEVITIGNRIILDDTIPVTDWPICDCFISFCSNNFPHHKALEYVKLRKPFCINDIPSQDWLKSREIVYNILKKNGISTPRHLYVYRNTTKLIETEEYVDVDGQRMSYPIIVKPILATDHNIIIFYGHNSGARVLFRKVNNKSSEFYPDFNHIPRDKDYVVEEFLRNGKDLKVALFFVYTIGPTYAHGETRKSPCVDGLVQRDPDNKELRLLTLLTTKEKEIASKICYLFRQNICGFDIIRWRGNSYVIDVNGWSFVKGNLRYYDRCARRIRKLCLCSKKGRASVALNNPYPPIPPGFHEHENGAGISPNCLSQPQPPSSLFLSGFNNDVLRSLVVIFRHADRTPKQKVKIYSNSPHLLAFFTKTPPREVKIKQPHKTHAIVSAIERLMSDGELSKKDRLTWQQAHAVLKAQFGGIKVQLKPVVDQGILIKCQCVCKWGGELTHAGLAQTKQYVPIFWNNLLRPVAPAPFSVTDDPDPEDSPEDSAALSQNMSSDLWPVDLMRIFQPVESIAKSCGGDVSGVELAPSNTFSAGKCRGPNCNIEAFLAPTQQSEPASKSGSPRNSAILSSLSSLSLSSASLSLPSSSSSSHIAQSISESNGLPPHSRKKLKKSNSETSASLSKLADSTQELFKTASSSPVTSKCEADTGDTTHPGDEQRHCITSDTDGGKNNKSKRKKKRKKNKKLHHFDVDAFISTSSAATSSSRTGQKLNTGVSSQGSPTSTHARRQMSTGNTTQKPLQCAFPAPTEPLNTLTPEKAKKYQEDLYYWLQRQAFLKGMQVYCTDEPRVLGTGHTFVRCTIGRHDIPPGMVHADKTVCSYLDDVSTVAEFMNQQKMQVKTLVQSEMPHFPDYRNIRLAHRRRQEQRGTVAEATGDSRLIASHGDGKTFDSEEKWQKVLYRRNRKRRARDGHGRSLSPQSTPSKVRESVPVSLPASPSRGACHGSMIESAAQCSCENEYDHSEECELSNWDACSPMSDMLDLRSQDVEVKSSAYQLPVTSLERPWHLRMTKWGRRCLRWLNAPKATLVQVLQLMKSLQTQIDRKLGANTSNRNSHNPIDKIDMFEEYCCSVHETEADDSTTSMTVPFCAKKKFTFPLSDWDAEILCGGETPRLLKNRWDRLIKSFYDSSTDTFDPTKIPDAYDFIFYDVCHNSHFLDNLRPLYRAIKRVADFVTPHEHGICKQDRLFVGKSVCEKLMHKIMVNLEKGLQDEPAARVFLYFSSESHLHALRNMLMLSGVPQTKNIAASLNALELSYLSHCAFRLFEDLSVPVSHPERFYVSVKFSPGAAQDPFIFLTQGHVLPVSRPIPINSRIPWQTFKQLFQDGEYIIKTWDQIVEPQKQEQTNK